MPLPTGPAPRNFWSEAHNEAMLLEVALAMMPPSEVSKLDLIKAADVVGEGRLSVSSCRSKLTLLRARGTQRLQDYESRQRVGGDSDLVDGGDERPRQVQVREDPVHDDRSAERSTPRQKQKIDTPHRLPKSSPKSKKRKRHTPYQEVSAEEPVGEIMVPPGSHRRKKRLGRASQRSASATRFSEDDEADGDQASEVGMPVDVKSEPRTVHRRPKLPGSGRTADTAIDLDEIEFEQIAPESSSRQNSVPDHGRDSRSEISLPVKNTTADRSSQSTTQPTQQGGSRKEKKGKKNRNKRSTREQSQDLSTQRKTTVTNLKPSGRIHARKLFTKTRSWQDSVVREFSVPRSEQDRSFRQRPGRDHG